MSIYARTIFVDNRNNQVRFLDWCQVATSLGSMVEPRQLNRFPVASNIAANSVKVFDPNDILAKITNISSAEQRQKMSLFNNLCGGEQMPQEYSY